MAPRKGESARERAARQAKASSLGVAKADCALIIAVLQEAPSSIKKVRDHLLHCGYISERNEILVKEEPLEAKCSPKGVAVECSDAPHFTMDAPIPSATPQTASSDFLAFLLMQLDRASFSWMSLKGMRSRGQKKVSPKTLQEILEFCCNISMELQWGCLKDVRALVEQLRCMASKCNRSARVILPPRWAESGIYSLRLQAGCLWLEHKDDPPPHGMAREIKISQELLGCECDDVGGFQLLQNFSAAKAKLTRKGSVQTWGCSELLLMGAARAEVRNAEEQLALEDGEPVEFITPPPKRLRSTPPPSVGASDTTLSRAPSCGSLPTPPQSPRPPVMKTLTKELGALLEEAAEGQWQKEGDIVKPQQGAQAEQVPVAAVEDGAKITEEMLAW